MRTIKFRAWDSDRKEMIYFDDFKIEDTGAFWGGDREVWRMFADYSRGTCEGSGYFHDDFSQKSNVEIMQFTGAHDKNGKEIYENEIFKSKHNILGKLLVNPVLIYEDLRWVLRGDDGNFEYLDYYETETELEIIGNIHNTPELLNEGV